MHPNPTPARCSRCGADWPAQLPGGLCPKCLLAAGLATQPQKGPEDTVVMPQPAVWKGAPQPGEEFGHYRLVRLLGQGGMGVVFEAEDLETGRRVALKILSQSLDSPEARKRFLREGQIAAAINHPNSVYVFGTEEIAGTPVIAMELVGGGTLRDRVMAAGPYAAAEAVDTILQIIAGLEAAQQAGVLHRDVKPSNCFIDPDGSVKIGDFGLSISTSVRTESNLTGAGSLFGTPAFSSPEQLRGEELTVRSDIYSVGVTLYYLLTGRMPFEAPTMVQLLVTVLEQRPQSPARLRAGIPDPLGRTVLRCLNKDAGARFDGYPAVRRALLPYASCSPTPATLALRFGAWLVDNLILSAFGAVLFSTAYGGMDVLMNPGQTGARLFIGLLLLLISVAYYGMFDGWRGGSPGKTLCRLRVVGMDGNTPGWRRGLLRALIYCGVSSLPAVAMSLPGQDWMLEHPLAGLIGLLPLVFQLLLFCTCRRQNGFAGLHDLGSRTRVLAHSLQPTRPGLPPALETPPATGELAQMGPYHILGEVGRGNESEILLGYDARLLRKVWLRRVPPATPPVAMALRHLARPGRFRWLNGRRADGEAWDVYEAAAGQPLLKLVKTKQDWEKVRFWLLDLAEELKSAEKDGSLPAKLGLERVWITTDGRAKLLDFPVPGITRPGGLEPVSPTSPGEFLRQTAFSALDGWPRSVAQTRTATLDQPLPLYARGFLQRLGTTDRPDQSAAQLKLLAAKRVAITPYRRLAMLALALAFPVFTSAMAGFGISMINSPGNLELVALHESLRRVETMEPAGTDFPVPAAVDGKKRRSLEIYIAGRFHPIITNSVLWNSAVARSLITPEERTLTARLIVEHPQVTPGELATATWAVESHHPLPRTEGSQPAGLEGMYQILPVMLYATPLMFVVIPCLLTALLFRGGLIMHGLGIAVVGRNGRPSRMRTLRRNLIAWLPFLLSPMLVQAAQTLVGRQWALLVAAGGLGGLTALSLALHRSLQDRLARTWLVPDGKTPADEAAEGRNRGRWPVIALAVGAGVLVLLLVMVPLMRKVANAQKEATARGNGYFITNKDAAKECTVLLPVGTPATNAHVWVGTNDNAWLDCFRAGEYHPQGMDRLQTDALGRFTLPGVVGDRRVILTDPSGILVTTAAEARRGIPLRLQSFGQVEGRLWSEGQPKREGRISIGILQDRLSLGLTYSTVSAQDGRFGFTNLPAGEYRLYRDFIPRRPRKGGFAVHPSHQMIVRVKAREITLVEWGGKGRSITGQAAAENAALKVDWLNDDHSLELVGSSSGGLKEFVRESWGFGESAATRLNALRAARSYHLEFEEDGSFRAEDVPPGTYVLQLRVTKPKAGPNPSLEAGEELGSLVRTVTIPVGTTPYDLGRQVVGVKDKPKD